MATKKCYNCGAMVEPDDDFPIPDECPECGGVKFVAEAEIKSIDGPQ